MPKRKPKIGDVIFWTIPAFPFVAGGAIERFGYGRDDEYPVVQGGAIMEAVAILPEEAAGPVLAELHALKLRYNAGHKELVRSLVPDLLKAVPFSAEVSALKRLTA